MKNLIFTIFLILFSTKIFAQCQPDNTLIAFYDEDVKDLALRRINMFDHPDKKKVEIPQIWQDTIWQSLAAIYNKTAIPQRDSVFNMYCIHHDSPNNTSIFREISVSEIWTYDPISFALKTNNPIIDAFLANHGVIFGYATVFNGKILKLTRPINTQALVDSLVILGVTSAFIESYVGDSNKITYRKEGNDQFFDFSLRWGDCQTGCIDGRIWKYKVSNSCDVTYVGTEDLQGGGYPFPPATNCNISTIITDPAPLWEVFTVYPNPVFDKLNVPAFSKKEGFADLKVFDIVGKLIFYEKINSKEVFELEVHKFAKGLYFVELSAGNTRKLSKFLKE
jgi:hypothetical protein